MLTYILYKLFSFLCVAKYLLNIRPTKPATHLIFSINHSELSYTTQWRQQLSLFRAEQIVYNDEL